MFLLLLLNGFYELVAIICGQDIIINCSFPNKAYTRLS